MWLGRNRTADERFEEAVRLYADWKPDERCRAAVVSWLVTWRGFAVLTTLMAVLPVGSVLAYRWHAMASLGITCGHGRQPERQLDAPRLTWRYYCPP
jgi:hypothetical protein